MASLFAPIRNVNPMIARSPGIFLPMPKVFNSPPLPFVGQKRNWVKTFRNLLTENIPDAGDRLDRGRRFRRLGDSVGRRKENITEGARDL